MDQIVTATAMKVVTPTQDASLSVSQAAQPRRATITAIQQAAQ
jgi:hypothetical protein